MNENWKPCNFLLPLLAWWNHLVFFEVSFAEWASLETIMTHVALKWLCTLLWGIPGDRRRLITLLLLLLLLLQRPLTGSRSSTAGDFLLLRVKWERRGCAKLSFDPERESVTQWHLWVRWWHGSLNGKFSFEQKKGGSCTKRAEVRLEELFFSTSYVFIWIAVGNKASMDRQKRQFYSETYLLFVILFESHS